MVDHQSDNIQHVDSQTLLNVGLLLLFSGACCLVVHRARRRSDRLEREARKVRRQLTEDQEKLDRLKVEHRMKHDERS